jgi:hypothetical protein
VRRAARPAACVWQWRQRAASAAALRQPPRQPRAAVCCWQVGSHSALLVRALMCLSAPISWPIGKLLDALLGEDQTVMDGWRMCVCVCVC